MSGVSVAVFAVAPIALLCSCWVMCSYYNVRRKQARRYAATPPSASSELVEHAGTAPEPPRLNASSPSFAASQGRGQRQAQ